jgi:hypothetical protein
MAVVVMVGPEVHIIVRSLSLVINILDACEAVDQLTEHIYVLQTIVLISTYPDDNCSLLVDSRLSQSMPCNDYTARLSLYRTLYAWSQQLLQK